MAPPSSLVSILIPAYNSGRWIGDTLRSAVGQTHANLEVIVVDDGSTDETAALVGSISDDRLKLIQQENSGACVARNRALEESKGDYIQFLDADDLLAPDKIEKQLTRLAEEPHGTVATSGWTRFYDGDISSAVNENRHDWKDYDEPIDWLIDSGLGRGTMPVHAWLIPRIVAEKAGPWNESLRINQDGEYNTRVVLEASKIAFVPDTLVYYRSGLAGTISRGDSEEALRSLLEATALISSYMLRRRDDKVTREAVAGMYRHVSMRAYPRYPQISQKAEREVTRYGGSARLPGGGRGFRLLRDTIGWKSAMRVQEFYRSLKSKG